MKPANVYPVLQEHPELTPVVKDLRWLTKALQAAVQGGRSRPLCACLMALHKTIQKAFWKLLYKVSDFSSKDKLELDLQRGVLIIHQKSPSGTSPAGRFPLSPN